MSEYSKLIATNPVDGSPYFKLDFEVKDNGACQCFKDCNCYEKRGEVTGYYYMFTHPLSTKRFDNLKSCEDSYKTKLKQLT